MSPGSRKILEKQDKKALNQEVAAEMATEGKGQVAGTGNSKDPSGMLSLHSSASGIHAGEIKWCAGHLHVIRLGPRPRHPNFTITCVSGSGHFYD